MKEENRFNRSTNGEYYLLLLGAKASFLVAPDWARFISYQWPGSDYFLARRCWKFLGAKAPLCIDLFKCQSFLAFGGECKHRRLASENGGSLACQLCPKTWENPFKTKKFD